MEIVDFSLIIEEVEKLDSQALVVFDVDETLIIPKDRILRPCGEQYLHTLAARFGKDLSEEQHKELRSITLLQREIAYTDSSVPLLFQKMKEKNIPSIALTAMPPGKYGVIPSLEEWREEELKRSGIDFTLHSPYKNNLNFTEFGEKTPLIFHRGILCSADYPKGPALKAFLEKTNIRPSRVIFVEDKKSNLVSVENELKNMGVSYLGFHYVGAMKFNEEVSEELAQCQLKHLVMNKKWLSDREAKEVLNNHPL